MAQRPLSGTSGESPLVTVRVTTDVLDRITAVAEHNGAARSDVVRDALNAGLPHLEGGLVSSGANDTTFITEEMVGTRAYRALASGGYRTVGDIRSATDAELLALRNFGDGALAAVRQFVAALSAPPTLAAVPTPHRRRRTVWKIRRPDGRYAQLANRHARGSKALVMWGNEAQGTPFLTEAVAQTVAELIERAGEL